MYRIIFRGKRVDNHKWIEGSYYFDDIWCDSYIILGMNDESPIMEEVIFETVGQYVGRKDKNNIKIFKDDIVKTNYVLNGEPVTCVVDYNPNLAKFILRPVNDLRKYLPDKCWNCVEEVIGNIHDNQELLRKDIAI